MFLKKHTGINGIFSFIPRASHSSFTASYLLYHLSAQHFLPINSLLQRASLYSILKSVIALKSTASIRRIPNTHPRSSAQSSFSHRLLSPGNTKQSTHPNLAPQSPTAVTAHSPPLQLTQLSSPQTKLSFPGSSLSTGFATSVMTRE